MFAYCRNNPVSRKDTSGTEDVCATDFNEDNNPLNDIGNPTGSGTGRSPASGATNSNNGISGSGSKVDPFIGGAYSSGQYYANSPGNNPQYTPPEGGGGVTSSTMVGSVRVTFAHGGRHIDPATHNYRDIQEVIAHDVVKQPQFYNSTKNVVITYDGRPMLYSYHPFNQYHISIGTYYFE